RIFAGSREAAGKFKWTIGHHFYCLPDTFHPPRPRERETARPGVRSRRPPFPQSISELKPTRVDKKIGRVRFFLYPSRHPERESDRHRDLLGGALSDTH